MSERDLASGQVERLRRKPYEKPTLQNLGSLTDLTQSTGHTSPNADGAAKGNTKTH